MTIITHKHTPFPYRLTISLTSDTDLLSCKSDRQNLDFDFEMVGHDFFE